MNDEIKNIVSVAAKSFKFQYVGGGYFRDSTIRKGVKAECFHGEEILIVFADHILNSLKEHSDDSGRT